MQPFWSVAGSLSIVRATTVCSGAQRGYQAFAKGNLR